MKNFTLGGFEAPLGTNALPVGLECATVAVVTPTPAPATPSPGVPRRHLSDHERGGGAPFLGDGDFDFGGDAVDFKGGDTLAGGISGWAANMQLEHTPTSYRKNRNMFDAKSGSSLSFFSRHKNKKNKKQKMHGVRPDTMAAGPSVNAELTQRYDLQRVRDVSWQTPITLGTGNGQTFDIFSATDLQILPHAVVLRLDDHGAFVTRLGNTVYVRSAPALTLGPAAFGQDRIGFDVPVPLQLPDYHQPPPQQQHQQHYEGGERTVKRPVANCRELSRPVGILPQFRTIFVSET